MNVTAEMVKELRAKTGAGIMDCKQALKDCEGDAEKAVDFLRKKGLATAQKRSARETAEGVVQSYIHMGGKIGVLLEVNCESDFVAKNDDFQEFSKNVAMHVAAINPLGLQKEDIPEAVIERERAIYKEQALEMGKPEKMIEKIIDGKIEKFYKDSCLMSQAYIKDPKISIEDLLNSLIAKIGENIKIKRFARFQIGE
jgi:elongation factor Ts